MIALVTGGGGFLGGAIVRRLVERGDTVRSLARGDYPELRAIGVEAIRGDIADHSALLRAADGCDAVFHVAAKAGVWGSREEYRRANVLGTQNVLEACRSRGVGRLVFTSSPSVIHGGGDLEGVDESIPYPKGHAAPYPATKAEAERLVLAANGPGLATVALRPHLIWGPGDNHLIPRIVARAAAGKLRRIGRRPVLVDSTFIDDAATAHLLAADRLAPGSPIAGKPYFVSQGEPWPLWDLVNGILGAAGVPAVTRTIPEGLAVLAGAILETNHRLFRREGEPMMTRFLAHQLSTAHWFDIGAARRDLDYRPSVTIGEGLRRLHAWFQADGGRASRGGATRV
jgi:nucleoside-diphosphate-sugar epimerase